MATNPRPWPNNAEAARLDSIAAFDGIARTGRVLRDRCEQMNQAEIVRRSGQIVDSALEGAQRLRACRSDVMEDTGKPKPNTVYMVWTSDTSLDQAKAAFVRQFGAEPQEMLFYKNMLWVGPQNMGARRG